MTHISDGASCMPLKWSEIWLLGEFPYFNSFDTAANATAAVRCLHIVVSSLCCVLLFFVLRFICISRNHSVSENKWLALTYNVFLFTSLCRLLMHFIRAHCAFVFTRRFTEPIVFRDPISMYRQNNRHDCVPRSTKWNYVENSIKLKWPHKI